MSLKPIEAFEKAVWWSLVTSAHSKIPGAAIKQMGSEVREALQGLKSDDVRKIRPTLLGEAKRRGRFNR